KFAVKVVNKFWTHNTHQSRGQDNIRVISGHSVCQTGGPRLTRTRCLIIDDESFNAGSFCAGNFRDRKSTRLNSSHVSISYAVFCLKKKNERFSYIWVDQIDDV